MAAEANAVSWAVADGGRGQHLGAGDERGEAVLVGAVGLEPRGVREWISSSTMPRMNAYTASARSLWPAARNHCMRMSLSTSAASARGYGSTCT